MKLQQWTIFKILALLAWINVFAWMWAVRMYPALHNGGWDWRLMLFFSIAILATLGTRD